MRPLGFLTARIAGALLTALMGCSEAPQATHPEGRYPSVSTLQIKAVCSLIYDERYVDITNSSRSARASKFVVVPDGIMVYFFDGSKRIFPLETGFSIGGTHYCGAVGPTHYPCSSASDQDPQCLRLRPIRKDRYQY